MTGERGVSPVLGYTLTLGVATILISGLMIASGGFVSDQREVTTRSELRVIGQQVSADIAAVDRLARTSGAGTIAVSRDLPDRVVGSTYTIHVRDDLNGPTVPYLELSTERPDITVTIGIASIEDVEPVSVHGGPIEIRYNGKVVIGRG